MALGVIGEYLGRMFDETKGRPLYLVKGYEVVGKERTETETENLVRNAHPTSA
jgi:dolichol-phosphate mannosyltransferase